MRTAQQMEDFCIANNLTEKKTARRVFECFKQIEYELVEDEKVLLCFIGMHDYLAPWVHAGERVYALTDKRFISCGKKKKEIVFDSTGIHDIIEFKDDGGRVMGGVIVDAKDGPYKIAMAALRAKGVVERANKLLRKAKRKSGSASIKKSKKTFDKPSLINKGYDDKRIKEILAGKDNGLTDAELEVYADRRFDFAQMKEIREGLEEGLTIEQVSVYADPKIGVLLMDWARDGFKRGLTKEQVAMYAKPDISTWKAWKIHENLLKTLES